MWLPRVLAFFSPARTEILSPSPLILSLIMFRRQLRRTWTRPRLARETIRTRRPGDRDPSSEIATTRPRGRPPLLDSALRISRSEVSLKKWPSGNTTTRNGNRTFRSSSEWIPTPYERVPRSIRAKSLVRRWDTSDSLFSISSEDIHSTTRGGEFTVRERKITRIRVNCCRSACFRVKSL